MSNIGCISLKNIVATKAARPSETYIGTLPNRRMTINPINTVTISSILPSYDVFDLGCRIIQNVLISKCTNDKNEPTGMAKYAKYILICNAGVNCHMFILKMTKSILYLIRSEE